MRGVLDVTVAYAAERRQYGVPVGSFQAVQHLLAEAHCLMEGSLSVALHASWAVDNLAPDDALRRRPRRQGVLRPRRAHRVRDRDPGARRHRQHVGVHRARVPAARAALVAVVRRRRRAAARAAARAARSRPMDFRDSPAEAEFRARLRAWLADNNPGLPASSTDDEYWARQAEWHTALYDAGFFGLSWPARYGGHDLPTVFDVILDEELAAAGAPPRPSLGYLVQGISHARQRRDQGPLPARAHQRPRALVPGLQRARRRLRPRVAAHHRDARRRRVRDRRPQDLDQLLRRRRLVHPPRAHRSRRAEAQGPVGVRGPDAPARHRATAAADDQRHHERVRPGAVRRRARRRREHDRRAGRGLARSR